MTIYRNAALDKMRRGKLALGMIVRLSRAGDIAMIAGATGHDFLFIDMQHGGMSPETVVDISVAALGAGVAPLVRVAGFTNPDTPRILDSGAFGIIAPNVETADDARAAVRTCKFKPVGQRSVAAGYPQLGYAQMHVAEATKHLNEHTLLACMIESRKGVGNIEAIAAVDGVDVLHLGVNDLLMEMGLPGQFGHSEIDAIVRRMINACKANGKFAGFGGDKDPERQAKAIREGVQFVTAHSDLAYLTIAATERTQILRAANPD